MSLQERHPFDEHFHRVLTSAEVQPPRGVLEAVLRERARRRKPRGGLSWWLISSLVVFLSAAGGAYWVSIPSQGGPEDEASGQELHPAITATEISGVSSEELDDEGHDGRASNNFIPTAGVAAPMASTHTPVTPSIGSTSTVTNVVHGAIVQGPTPVQHMASVHPFMIEPADDPSPTPAIREEEPHTSPREPAREVPTDPLAPLSIRIVNDLTHHPPSEAQMPAYVLPHGHWWLGASVGFNDVRLHWMGNDERLADALDNSEAVHSTISLGFSFGRTWRSGWGLSTGMFHERSERHFEHTETSSTHETSVLTYVVTLDTQVFVSNVDTLESFSTLERRTSGVNRRTVLRIPLEAHWQGQVRRWNFGIRGGVAMEFTRADHALTLDLRSSDGNLVATELSGEATNGRYPTALLFSAGLDVGYLFHERWSIQGGPAYMRSIMPLGNKASVYATPERWGLQLGLVHHFNDR